MVKPIDRRDDIKVAALLGRSRIVNENRLTIGELVLDYNTLDVNKKDISIRVLP